MKCPFCSHAESKVIDKRDSDESNSIRRRRECLKCEKRWTTYERIEDIQIYIIKKDGRRELFSREKLKSGLLKALEKRPVPIEKIDKVVDEIEGKLRSMESTEINSGILGELVMKKLKSLDPVAYIRFASVYRSFDDVKDFIDELKALKK